MNASTGRPKIAVVGGGAVGGFIAGALAAANNDVSLCVRTPFAALSVESGGQTLGSTVAVATDPARVAPADWIFLATKAQHTAEAASWLARLAHPGAHIVVAQNGVAQEERVAPIAKGATILPSVVFISGERVSPGKIVHRFGHWLHVPAGEAADALARLAAGSRLDIRIEPDFVTESWRKLLINVTSNPLSALTERRMDVYREPDLIPIARTLMTECVAVARAEGARLGPDDVERTLDGFRTMNPSAGTSMLYDRLAGAPMEHEFLTGTMVKIAERHGIDVPMNRTILALMRALEGGLQR